MSKRYVLGFVISDDGLVILVPKEDKFHAEPQRSEMWNGVGGAVDDHEHEMAAIIRLAKRDTGIDMVFGWNNVGEIIGDKSRVDVFCRRIGVDEARMLANRQIHHGYKVCRFENSYMMAATPTSNPPTGAQVYISGLPVSPDLPGLIWMSFIALPGTEKLYYLQARFRVDMRYGDNNSAPAPVDDAKWEAIAKR